VLYTDERYHADFEAWGCIEHAKVIGDVEFQTLCEDPHWKNNNVLLLENDYGIFFRELKIFSD